MPETSGAKSIERAINLLELLSRQKDGLSLSEIVKQMRIPKSTVHRIVTTLEKRRLVRQNRFTGIYTLGFRILKYSNSLLEGLDIKNLIHPFLVTLNRDLDESVHLGMLDNNYKRVIYIDKLDSSKTVRMISFVGKAVPVHCTALGKAILSQLSDETIRKILSNYDFKCFSPNTINNIDDFLKNLENVRQQGYAIDLQENDQHVCCVGAVISNDIRPSMFAISVSAPASRLNLSNFDEVAEKVIKTTKEIRKQIANLPLNDNV